MSRRRGATVQGMPQRLKIAGNTPKPPLPAPAQVQSGTPAPVAGKRRVILIGEPNETSVYRRGELLGGHVLAGPALVDQNDTTVYLPPGWFGAVHTSGSLIVRTDDVR